MLNFLSYPLWQDAINLVNAQLALLRDRNWKHFKTVSFVYYLALAQKAEPIAFEDYFSRTIQTGLFYGLRREFSMVPYVVPKTGVGLREYRFLSYPLRVVHYAVGLYLLKLFQEFSDEYIKTHQHIRSFYGGDIRYENHKLLTNTDRLVFYKHYKAFKRLLFQQAKAETANSVMIKLDVQNYFDNISVLRLTQLLEANLKPAEQRRFGYTLEAQSEIFAFYEFLSRGRGGIPQSDNDVIASFIGHLYLTFGDMRIDDEINRYREEIESHKITRYMDDIYIKIIFHESVKASNRLKYVSNLLERITQSFYYNLDLRLNTKTEIFWLNDEAQLATMIGTLKKVSYPNYIPQFSDEADLPADPNERLNLIFQELDSLAGSSEFDDGDEASLRLNTELLKDIFDRPLQQLLQTNENQARIKTLFQSVDFDQVKIAPLETMLLIFNEQSTAENFVSFLCAKTWLTVKDINLIMQSLCMTDSSEMQKTLLARLFEDNVMQEFSSLFAAPEPLPECPGYFHLNRQQCNRIGMMSKRVMHQMQLRIKSEDLNSHSVALNHLLNEFQTIVAFLYRQESGETPKNFEAPQLITFLQRKKIPHDSCIAMRNLFDRRHSNQVSHAGNDDSDAWSVTKEEYASYKVKVGNCIEQLLNAVGSTE